MMLHRRPADQTALEKPDLRGEWIKELRQIKHLMENNEKLFNMTCDFDVTDYTIHERNALNTRYRYLLRCIRACDAQPGTAPVQQKVNL